ncbi:MAG: hypothetical protein WC389_06560 [Lutibacter sp.]
MAAIIRNSNLFCTCCGGEFKLQYPIPSSDMINKTNQFTALHKDCKQTWVEPEVDQSKNLKDKMMFWLSQGERGISSETMFTVLAGDDNWCLPKHRYSYPCDPDDFRRCYLLLKTIPEWKPELYKLKRLSPVWSKLVDNWDKLTEMLEEQMKTHKPNGMYELMKSFGC